MDCGWPLQAGLKWPMRNAIWSLILLSNWTGNNTSWDGVSEFDQWIRYQIPNTRWNYKYTTVFLPSHCISAEPSPHFDQAIAAFPLSHHRISTEPSPHFCQAITAFLPSNHRISAKLSPNICWTLNTCKSIPTVIFYNNFSFHTYCSYPTPVQFYRAITTFLLSHCISAEISPHFRRAITAFFLSSYHLATGLWILVIYHSRVHSCSFNSTLADFCRATAVLPRYHRISAEISLHFYRAITAFSLSLYHLAA